MVQYNLHPGAIRFKIGGFLELHLSPPQVVAENVDDLRGRQVAGRIGILIRLVLILKAFQRMETLTSCCR